MPANTIIPAPGAVDQKAEQMTPFIGPNGAALWDPYWYCRLVEDGEGSIPGRAEIVIANDFGSVDETANTVAWNPDGVSGKLKQNMDVQIFRSFQTFDQDGVASDSAELIFTGKLNDVFEERNKGVDQIIVSAADARIELQKVRVIGRVVCTVGGGTVSFQAGWPAHFNPGGRPNCIFDSQGNPWFAPWPDSGAPGFADAANSTNAAVGENPPPAKDKDVSQACYWTLGTIMTYLRNVYGPNAPNPSSLSSDFTFFPYIAKCPSWVLWPETFAASIDNEIQANFDAGIGQNNSALGSSRKGPDVNVNGLYLSGEPGKEGAFDILFGKSGGWTWNLKYGIDPDGSVTGTQGQVYNTLEAVPSRYMSSAKGVDLPFAAGGNAATTLKTGVITRGTVRKGSQNTCTRSIGMGGLVKVETRVGTDSTGLVNSWTAARQTSFLNDWIANGGDEKAFYLTIAQYAEVLGFVQLDSAYNFMTGTSYAAWPRAQISRPIWPYLLSYQGGSTGPKDSIANPYPIRVEVDTVGDGSGWTVATEFSMAQILDNGMIDLTVLRNIPLAQDAAKPGIWRFAAGKSLPITAPADIVVCPVRFTCAIPCDNRMAYAIRIASDKVNYSTNADGFFDVSTECPDADEFDPSFSRSSYLELYTLYEKWVQYHAWPIPQSVPGSTIQSNTQLRDDYTLLQSHLRRDLREKFRLNREGTDLTIDGTFTTVCPPGTLINNLIPRGVTGRRPYPLKGVVSRRRFVTEMSIERGIKSFVNYTSHLIR